jgi:hypothetical protein
MAVTPLVENTRIEIKIQPWAIKGTDNTRMEKSALGLWFTAFNPLYANSKALEIQAGALLAELPDSILKLALFEASRWSDAISKPSCASPNIQYFKQIRYRYVILKALEFIIGETQGVFPVRKKILGDFTIEYNTNNNQANLLSRVMDELKKLEPVVMSGGCLGIGTDYGPMGVSKGANDPYRPILSRQWYEPNQGESGQPNEILTPGYNRYAKYVPDRYRQNHNRSTRRTI